MFKRILAILGISLVVLIAAGYFVVATWLNQQKEEKQVCQEIRIVITDSTEHRFVQPKDIQEALQALPESLIGKHLDQVNLYELEESLQKQGAINRVEASINQQGTLRLEVNQRKPIARFQTKTGAFYVDREHYFFPWSSQFTAYVPIISGNIPIQLEENHRGKVSGMEASWIQKMLQLVDYLDTHPFWQAQIQQIHVEKNGHLSLYTRVGDQVIRFGKPENIDLKFRKLNSFYDHIVPTDGWNTYSEINLEVRDQVICTQRKQKKKK